MTMLVGRAGALLRVQTDAAIRGLTVTADQQLAPSDKQVAPPGTPLGPASPIEHVFYVVRENRTYDQVLGSDPRGDGDASLTLLDDNGVAGPTGGVTPNAHALASAFPLLDHVFANSEVSLDGHKITIGAVAIDFLQRSVPAIYANRGRLFDVNAEPANLP